jgi:hypothetical protein
MLLNDELIIGEPRHKVIIFLLNACISSHSDYLTQLRFDYHIMSRKELLGGVAPLAKP